MELAVWLKVDWGSPQALLKVWLWGCWVQPLLNH